MCLNSYSCINYINSRGVLLELKRHFPVIHLGFTLALFIRRNISQMKGLRIGIAFILDKRCNSSEGPFRIYISFD